MEVAPILTQPISLLMLVWVGTLLQLLFIKRGDKIKTKYLQSEEESNHPADTTSLINYISEMNRLNQENFFIFFLLFISAIVLAFYIYN